MPPSADHLDTANPAIVGAGQTINPPFTDTDANALGQLGAAGEEWTRPHSNLWADAFRRLIRNRLALIGLIIVTVFVLMAIFAPLLAPYGQSEVVDVRLTRMGPSWTWPMGLDKNGRDIFSRLMWGSRVSLTVGLASYAVILLIALPFGSIAGFYGGMTDTVLMRIVDVIYTIPQVLLVMLFVNARGPSLFNIILGIGLIGWTTEARLIRAQFLTLREQEYVKASRVAGASGGYIILRHLLPNSLTPIIVAATFGIPTAIFIEAALSFVGVGSASTPADIISTPHMLIFPVIAIGLVMLGFTFLGDGLRDALDPKGND